MGLPVGELQVAYISLYRGDTTLQGLLVGSTSPTWNVFDATGVPTNTAFPYVTIQQISAKTGILLSMGQDAKDILVLVNILTQSGGFLQSRAIAKQIDHLTQMQSIALTGGFNNPGTLLEMYQEIPGKDGLTEQIAMRYRAWTQG